MFQSGRSTLKERLIQGRRKLVRALECSLEGGQGRLGAQLPRKFLVSRPSDSRKGREGPFNNKLGGREPLAQR